MIRSRAALLLACFLLLPASAGWAVDDVGALIDNVVAAHGGVSGLSKAKAVRQTGTVTSTMRGEKGTLLRVYERPSRLRIEIGYGAGSTEVRILDGGRGWRESQAVYGPPLDAMILQAARLDAPWLLHRNRERVRDRGAVESGGKPARALEIPLAGGLTLTVEIDPSSGRIVRTVGKGPGGGGHAMSGIEFVATYDDFREVDGVLFAFREGNYAMGQHTGDTVLTKVELTANPPEETFRPKKRGVTEGR